MSLPVRVVGVLGLIITLLMSMATGCHRKQAAPGDHRPRIDRSLMACLGAIRAYHRQADLHLARGDTDASIAAVEQIVGLKCLARNHPEVREAVLDAYGRLARLHMRRGRLDQAGQWLARGLKRSGPPSFFRANLYMVEGDLLDARAQKLEASGKKEAANQLRRQAIGSFERSAKMNKRLLEDLVK